MRPNRQKNIQRPFGVYAAAIVAVVNFGILNFFGNYWEISHSNGEMPFSVAYISLGLSVFTAAAAVWMLSGDNTGRLVLLVLLPLNVLWVVLWSATALLDVQPANDAAAVAALMRQPVSGFVVAVIEWYLMTEKAVAYFKQNDRN
ncbi:MAG: hypothetical protein JSS81_30485 [Acidobacteria bacterium]|nr:hypothetical protein [Acidobacteriota bacterium]